MSLLDTAKDAYELAKKGMTIELQEKIMDLREQALALEEENLRLRSRVRDLEEKQLEKEAMKFKAPFYFRDGDPVPFCAVCWEDRAKAMHMRAFTGGDGKHYLRCGGCQTTEIASP